MDRKFNPGITSILFVFGIATFLILVTATQNAIIVITDPAGARPLLSRNPAIAIHWYLWALFVVPVYRLARRISSKERKRALVFFTHLALGFAFALVNILLQSSLLSLFYPDSFSSLVATSFYARLFIRTSFYFLIVIGCYVHIAHQRRREEELKARDLEIRLAIAQFQVLKSKLNPEFLFKTLQSISVLMRKDIEAADLLTARLGDFLRLSLESACASYVPLQEEVELVRSYLEIQRVYHPDLQIAIDVTPRFSLIPIPNHVLLDMVQTIAPEEFFHLSTSADSEFLNISISPSRKMDSLSQPAAGFEWHTGNGTSTMKVPLSRTFGIQTFSGESTFESLEEFHRSLAGKEKQIQNAKPSLWRKFWNTFGIWTFIAIFFTTRELLTRSSMGEPLQLKENLRFSAAWYWWVLLTPLIFYLCRKFPVRIEARKRNIALHLLFSFLVGVCMLLLYVLQDRLFGASSEQWPLSQMFLRYPYLFDALTYWAVVGVHEALAEHKRHLQEELRTAKLKGNLIEAQVQALKMQLHPHFLFNTLNSISELMHEDIAATEQMLKRLEDFLRLTFQNSDVQEITVQKELEFLRNYLEIQQVRFQNRLRVDMDIDPQVMKDRVPNLILQPIVENAIRHGVSPRIDSGRVEIRAFHKNGKLLLEVEDDGPGMRDGNFREGVGMSNTRMRLEQIYGRECHFAVRNNPQGGLIVTLQIPATSEAAIS